MYTPCPFTVRAGHANRGPLLVVTGDIDFEVAPLLVDALEQVLDHDLDLFCDSSGLHTLLTARTAEARGITLRLADPSPR
ncbi:STAS domain-containing protein [Kitasatospora sp. MBT63]|uniref:STAS domain-containing protein n=1 Tax=Kitasatospora sp. MBT63 TaxID=1444768 RepID=UPI00053B2F5F|nr:STAS domain-containing protein [Kitasatospora sp. MBT63]